jgi:hypothetical protein
MKRVRGGFCGLRAKAHATAGYNSGLIGFDFRTGSRGIVSMHTNAPTVRLGFQRKTHRLG